MTDELNAIRQEIAALRTDVEGLSGALVRSVRRAQYREHIRSLAAAESRLQPGRLARFSTRHDSPEVPSSLSTPLLSRLAQSDDQGGYIPYDGRVMVIDSTGDAGLLLETGDSMLTEDGDLLLLDGSAAALPVLPDDMYPVGTVIYFATDGKLYRNVAEAWVKWLDGGDILPGTVDAAAFAATLRPPALVTSLPSLPDSDYPQGALVFLTTDEKLYRNTDGSTWSVAVDGGDVIANTIVAGALSVSALSAIAANVGLLTAGVIQSTDGNVVFDLDNGILYIYNGKITLEDEYGGSALTAAGFSGSWADFVRLGLYNARFQSVTVGTLTNDATSDLPYWDMSATDGVWTGLSGGGVKATFSALNDSNYLDSAMVPVRPGAWMEGGFAFLANRVAGSMDFSAFVFWFDADGSYISAYPITDDSVTSSVTSLTWYRTAMRVPDNAVSAYLEVGITETSSHNASNSVSIYATSLVDVTVSIPGGWKIGDASAVGGITISGTKDDYDPGSIDVASLYEIGLSACPDPARAYRPDQR